MSKPTPTLSALYNKLVTDIKNKLGIISILVKFVINALSAVLAAQLKSIYIYMVDVQNNQFPDTADTVANGGTLERMGVMYLGRLPFPATDGTYNATVTGVSGSFIPKGSTFLSNAGSNAPGFLYTNDNDYYLPASTGTLALRSVLPGADYLLLVGDTLTPTAPILGVDNVVTISAITQTPTSAEDTEVYRQAVLNSLRLQPQGGSKTDYREWATDANGVRLVYPYVKNGEAGTVQVYVEAVTASSTDGHGTPSSGLLTDVADVIEMSPDTTLPANKRGRRPIQANIEVLPVNPTPVDITITGLQVDSSSIRNSIRTSVESYLYGVRPYISGADLPREKNDVLSSVKMQSVITDTIGNANTFLTFAMAVNGVTVNSYTFSLANIPYLRNVTYN
jgi:uncharacterized phage protein gp47/JayE